MKAFLMFVLLSISAVSFAETHTYYCGSRLSSTGWGA